MKPDCYINKSSNTKTLKQTISFLKTISEENRLKIIHLLCFGKKCVCEIWQYLNLPQNLVSHHLKILKDFDLVFSNKEGLKVIYKLNKKALTKHVKLLNKFLNPKKK